MTRWPISCSPGKGAVERGLHSFFTSQLRRQYLPHGHVYTTAQLDGVALWGPPDRHRQGLRELFQLLPTSPFLVSSRMVRALRLLSRSTRSTPGAPLVPRHPGDRAGAPGPGIGSTLLKPVLERADEDGVPAYLESSKERNVPLYRRFGFEVIDEYRSKVGSPPIWRMWREPKVPEL